MRLLLDATPLLGTPTGVGRYVRGLLDGLDALDDPPDVTLLAVSSGGPAPLARATGLHVRGRRLPARGLHAAWGHLPVPTADWLAGGGRQSGGGAAGGRQRERRYDVVHGTNYVLPPTRAAGVVSVHDLSYAHFPESVTPATRRYGRLVSRALTRGALAVTLTATLAAEVAEHHGLPADRVLPVRPGVDAGWAAAAPMDALELAARGLPPVYLLFVGSVEPRKNVPLLLAALRRTARSGHEIPPLVLAGPAGWGPAPDLSGLPPGAVLPAGYLDDTTLRRLVAGARALVFPSRYEGFGLPPLEALACGTPVLCSDLPVLREVLGPQPAYLPADPEAWADALERLDMLAPLDDGSRAARARHAAGWTWERCAQEAMAAYSVARGQR